MMTWEGVTSIALYSVTTSGLLAAFALALGANSFQIGILAAIPFIMQPIQIPSILLVERLRLRKAIAVLSWYPAQAMWILIALIPVFVGIPSGAAVALLLTFTAVRGALTAVCNSAWFSWVKDLVPQHILGRFHSKRLAWATVASIVFGLSGAFFVQWWSGRASDEAEIWGYTIVLLLGAVFLGMSDPTFMAQMPERTMEPLSGARPSLRKMLATPFRDRNFRQLINFMFFWGFASNLAIPFFAVYMLEVLEFPILAVIALATLSQLFNVAFFSIWGLFADKFGSKVVLSLSTSLYLLVIGGWVFVTMPDRYILTIPLVVLLHVFAGIASAGVSLTMTTLGYKLAPQGQSTPYLAGLSLATSLGAGISPLIGGWLADFFSVRELTVTFGWNAPGERFELPTILLSGFDFLFALAFVIGVITLNALTTIREEGEVDRKVVLAELFGPTRHLARGVSSVPGLRALAEFPYAYLRHVPGMDVALGVTAYEIAAAARRAVSAAATSRKVMAGAASHVGAAIAETMKQTVLALGQTQADPLGAFWGAGYGIIQGANEAGINLRQAATHTVEEAREAARGLGLSEETAAAHAAQGVLDAAQTIGDAALAEVKQALPLPTSVQPRLGATERVLGEENVV